MSDEIPFAGWCACAHHEIEHYLCRDPECEQRHCRECECEDFETRRPLIYTEKT